MNQFNQAVEAACWAFWLPCGYDRDDVDQEMKQDMARALRAALPALLDPAGLPKSIFLERCGVGIDAGRGLDLREKTIAKIAAEFQRALETGAAT